VLPDIAIGAIVAATIGALITLVGLIVSKESKVSEFRQAWIDALRDELSSYLTNLSAVEDAQALTFKDPNERFTTLQPYYGSLNEAYYKIAFRLNPEEDLSIALKACMVSLSTEVHHLRRDDGLVERLKVEYINTTNELLKAEWKIVKKGEMVFRITKYLTATFLGLLIALAAARLYQINSNVTANVIDVRKTPVNKRDSARALSQAGENRDAFNNNQTLANPNKK